MKGSEVAQSCPTLCDPVDCIALQAPLSMGFSRQEYWSGLPFPSPRDLPDPGIEPRSPALQADALTSEPPGKPWPEANLNRAGVGRKQGVVRAKGDLESPFKGGRHHLLPAVLVRQSDILRYVFFLNQGIQKFIFMWNLVF